MKNLDQETIIAQCTPQGSGALALIRMSGDDALTIATAISTLASGIPLHAVPSHTVHYGWIKNHAAQEAIDQVLFIVMHGPKTFTGQHVVEITCHNNQFLVEAIIAQAVEHGARLAQQGEFSKRAFLHGKIDLVQAEAINELIHASTQQALKKALSQVEGTFSAWIASLEKELIKNLALTEASFEFIDEEMEFGSRIKESIEALVISLSTLKQTFNQQQHLRQGIRVALLGSVNAGKSSLFNALVKKNRAIVSPQAGTTRDTLEAGMYKEGFYITFIDTAGLRQTDDSIEQEGIQRSLAEAHNADIIVLVFDSSRAMTAQERAIYQDLCEEHSQKIIVVANKADKEAAHAFPLPLHTLKTSVLDSQSIHALEQEIEKKIHTLFSHLASPFLLNARHITLLLSLEKQLQAIFSLVSKKNAIDYEIVAYHLKNALENLTELSGKTISEQGMDAIFREFCIGK